VYNYLKLRSCSNLACETFQLVEPASETPAARLSRVQSIARQWGLGNGSDAVEVSVESFNGDCVVSRHAVAIDRPEPAAVEVDEDEQPVTITITKAQARVVLAGLSRRYIELEALGGWEAEALGKEAKATYQSIDKQVYGDA
jgi:hypothetical protein